MGAKIGIGVGTQLLIRRFADDGALPEIAVKRLLLLEDPASLSAVGYERIRWPLSEDLLADLRRLMGDEGHKALRGTPFEEKVNKMVVWELEEFGSVHAVAEEVREMWNG